MRPKDRGRTNVGFQPIESKRNEIGQDLRHHRKRKNLRIACARSPDRLDDAFVDILDRFREQFGQHGCGMNGQGQGSGEGTESHRGDEQQA